MLNLDAMIDPYRSTEDFSAASQRPEGTIFQYPLSVIDKVTDYNPPVPSENSNDFARQIDIPSVLGLELTDKTSRGVYEGGNSFKERDANPPFANEPFVNDSFVPEYTIDAAPSNFKTRDANPVDATILNNPAVDGLGTGIINNASPLGANFAGQNVLVQGTDPFYPPQYGASPVLANVEDTTTAEPTKPSDCSWYDLPCVWQTLKGEVTLVIVGLVLLAIGIYALTR